MINKYLARKRGLKNTLRRERMLKRKRMFASGLLHWNGKRVQARPALATLWGGTVVVDNNSSYPYRMNAK